MSDLLERLRRLEIADGTGDHKVHWMRNPDGSDAAREIERLRLTVDEREAIYRAEARLRTAYVPDEETAATLRKLLERLA